MKTPIPIRAIFLLIGLLSLGSCVPDDLVHVPLVAPEEGKEFEDLAVGDYGLTQEEIDLIQCILLYECDERYHLALVQQRQVSSMHPITSQPILVGKVPENTELTLPTGIYSIPAMSVSNFIARDSIFNTLYGRSIEATLSTNSSSVTHKFYNPEPIRVAPIGFTGEGLPQGEEILLSWEPDPQNAFGVVCIKLTIQNGEVTSNDTFITKRLICPDNGSFDIGSVIAQYPDCRFITIRHTRAAAVEFEDVIFSVDSRDIHRYEVE